MVMVMVMVIGTDKGKGRGTTHRLHFRILFRTNCLS
jgi:hypothetical protein